MLDRNDLNRLQGATVRTAAGDKIGNVSQVYLDDETGRPEWVTVRTGLFGLKESFVPLSTARFERNQLVVDATKEQVNRHVATRLVIAAGYHSSAHDDSGGNVYGDDNLASPRLPDCQHRTARAAFQRCVAYC